MLVRCVLFDWDGTLQKISLGKILGYAIIRKFGNGWLRRKLFEVMELFDMFLCKPALVLTLRDLEKIKDNVFVGIVTNRSKMFMERMFRRACLSSSFFDVVGATWGILNAWKNASCEWVLISPKPAPFASALRTHFLRMGVRLEEVLYVGDDVIDYLAVKGTGIRFAAIAHNEGKRKAFVEAGVPKQEIFSDIHDALRYFGVFI